MRAPVSLHLRFTCHLDPKIDRETWGKPEADGATLRMCMVVFFCLISCYRHEQMRRLPFGVSMPRTGGQAVREGPHLNSVGSLLRNTVACDNHSGDQKSHSRPAVRVKAHTRLRARFVFMQMRVRLHRRDKKGSWERRTGKTRVSCK